MEGARPFTNRGNGLPGSAGTSRAGTEPPPSRSILPACCRNCSRSRDSRLHCSLCARHLSSSSRTLHCERPMGRRGRGPDSAAWALHVPVCTRAGVSTPGVPVYGKGRPRLPGEQHLMKPRSPLRLRAGHVPFQGTHGNHRCHETLHTLRSKPGMDCFGLCTEPGYFAGHFVVDTCSESWWRSPDLRRAQCSAPSQPSAQGRPPPLLPQLVSSNGGSGGRVSLAPWLPPADTSGEPGVGVSLGDTGQAQGRLPCNSLPRSPVPPAAAPLRQHSAPLCASPAAAPAPAPRPVPGQR